ncbi:MAG: Asparagine synthetase [glutamine-hydrolyzing] 1 [Myxococcota bacterium]|nr:Asparagine synthetase [glutamine-hydrolyzing] 1 [Myxococcota bacterium]
MCGIYGEVCFHADSHAWKGEAPAAPDEQRVRAATTTLHHRGPDGEGFRFDGPAALGHRRLAIIDLAGSPQPMSSPGGRWTLTYNGEIYNYRELRDRCAARGWNFRTAGDTEALLAGLCLFGTDWLLELNGIFAFGLWDREKRELFLARDPMGVKPLYFTQGKHRFSFASEPKALLADKELSRAIDPASLDIYLGYGHTIAPWTIFASIQKLQPGHCLRVTAAGMDLRRYYSPPAESPDMAHEPVIDQAKRLRALVFAAIERQMVADVPVGAFLSGGVDSAAVAAVMQQVSSDPVNTYTVGYPARWGFNEAAFARETARELGTRHHELEVTEAMLAENIPALTGAYDEPFADLAGIPTLLLSRLARRDVKVVLSGEGGDELFGGYRKYALDPLAAAAGRIPGLGEAARHWMRGDRRSGRAAGLLSDREGGERMALWNRHGLDIAARRALLHPEWRYQGAWTGETLYQDAWKRHAGRSPANRMMAADQEIWLGNGLLDKVDRATMAAGLEARVPLLDMELVRYCHQLPSSRKVAGPLHKWLFKLAIRDLVPRRVLLRRKRGFDVPLDQWLRGPLAPLAQDILHDARFRERGVFLPQPALRLLEEHLSGAADHSRPLWMILMFELWARRWMDGKN